MCVTMSAAPPLPSGKKLLPSGGCVKFPCHVDGVLPHLADNALPLPPHRSNGEGRIGMLERSRSTTLTMVGGTWSTMTATYGRILCTPKLGDLSENSEGDEMIWGMLDAEPWRGNVKSGLTGLSYRVQFSFGLNPPSRPLPLHRHERMIL